MAYRTVSEAENMSAAEIMDSTRRSPVFKTSGNGGRVYGGGMYMADELTESRAYGCSSPNTMGAVFNSKAKILDRDNLDKEAKKWIKSHPKSAKQLGIEMDPSDKVKVTTTNDDLRKKRTSQDKITVLAIAMGYNAVYDKLNGYYNVFDRSILTTSTHNYY